MQNHLETIVRLIIVAACIYVSALAVIDFYQTMQEFRDMPTYPMTPHDPTAGDFRRAMWIAFGFHVAASAVAICAAGEHALKMWLVALLPFHALPCLFIVVLSLSIVGILGGLVLAAMNWAMTLALIGALVATAGLGYGLAIIVEEDASDRAVRRACIRR